MLGRHALLIGLTTMAVLIASVGCLDENPQIPIQHTVTSTVSVDTERQVTFESWTPLEVIGDPARRDILVELEATVSASTATRARQLAEALEVDAVRPDADTIQIAVMPPAGAQLSGTMRVVMPARMAVGARVHVGSATVQHIEGAIAISAAHGAQVVESRSDLAIAIERGHAQIDSQLLPGSRVEVESASGDIVLWLPEALSADITADIGQSGEVQILHPALPRAAGIRKTRYRASVKGGLSTVRVLTGAGRIVIRAR